MEAKVTTSIYLDDRREMQGGKYPIKLRVTYRRKRMYYGIGYSFTKDEFKRITSDKPRGKAKEYSMRFNLTEQQAAEIIKELPVFTFPEFKKRFFNELQTDKDVFKSFDAHIKSLNKNGQVGTASTYQTAKKSFQEFCHNRSKLSFQDVTPGFLKDYEKWMLAKPRSVTTISMNVRCLRRLFKLAIAEGNTLQDFFPFGDPDIGRYKVPEHRNIKRALHKEDIKKIFDYTPEPGSAEAFCRDLWLFSYLCNGMNVADICRLKYRNIQGDSIIFLRIKTRHNRSLKPVIAVYSDEVKIIIDRWGNKPRMPQKYIFNVLSDRLTPAAELAKVKQLTKTINKYIGRIAKAVGIEQDVTTLAARHSFATVLKREGESIAYISESLGHSNLQTTENYLSSFTDEKRKEAAKKLTNW